MGRARLAQGIVELNNKFVGATGRSPLRRDAAVLAFFLALACVMTNPLVRHIASAVEDKQDALLNTWIIAWVGHALITDPLNLFSANIFYPYPNPLAFSETMLPQGLFALPFNLASHNTVLGYNLVLLASFVLAAYAMYLFIFDLTRNRGAGIIAGIIFAFNPYNLSNLAQVQLLSFGWMPLALLFLNRLLARSDGVQNSKRRAKILNSPDNRILNYEFRICFLFALFFSLQALSSFYYAFLAGFAVALYILWFFITHRELTFTFCVLRFTRLLASALIAALLVVPFFLPYVQVQREMGFERKLVDSEPFSANLRLYIEVSPHNVLYGNLLAPRPPIMLGGYPLDNLFPGIIAVVLAVLGIAATRNRDKWFYFLLLAFSFLLSLGPRLFLAPSVGTDIPLPYRWLYDIFPVMRALRAPVRFDALVMFALAVLAGLGMQKAESSRQKADNAVGFLPTAYRILPSLLVVLSAIEYLALPAAQITPVPTGDAIPQYVHWLRQQPNTTILELPMIASDPTQPLDLTTQYLSTYHWHATPDGYSGFNPPRRGEMAYEMQFFPSERAISLLQALGVEYVIAHSNRMPDWGMQHEAIGRAPELRLAKQAANDYVYRVAARPQDASSLFASAYFPQPAAPNQSYLAYIIVRNRGRFNFAVKPPDRLEIDAQWSDGSRQQVSASFPLVTSSASVIPVRLRAPSRAGLYQLSLRVHGSGINEWNLSHEVAVRAGESAHQVVIPASVGLRSPLKSQYVPGASLAIDLTWLPLNKIDAYYSASVRVIDSRGTKVVAQDREPSGSTFLWTPTITVSDQFSLTLPTDLAPGEYSLQLLMYQADQGIAALLLDQEYVPRETITLGTFIVK